MNIFLKLKHWQLFGLLFCSLLLTRTSTTVIELNNKSISYSDLSPIAFLFIAVLLGWFYSMGVNLHKKLPETVKISLKAFKWFLFIPVAGLVFNYLFIRLVLINRFLTGDISGMPLFLVIGLFSLFSIFCIIYCVIFVAKSLKAIELERPVIFNDYAGEFCLFLLFPIGIWIIQPKMNKIFENTIK